jgi:hypothetical protein
MLPAMIRKSLLERIRVHLGDGGLDNLEVQDALGLRICLGFVVGELSILQNKVALLKLSTGIIIVPASPPGIGGSSYTGTLTSLRWPSKPPSKSCPSQPPSKSCPLLRYDSLQSSLSCRKVHQAWRWRAPGNSNSRSTLTCPGRSHSYSHHECSYEETLRRGHLLSADHAPTFTRRPLLSNLQWLGRMCTLVSPHP